MFRYRYELPEIGTEKLTNKSISNVGQEITVSSSVFYDRKFSKVVSQKARTRLNNQAQFETLKKAIIFLETTREIEIKCKLKNDCDTECHN